MFLNSADLEQIPELRREKGGLEREVTKRMSRVQPNPSLPAHPGSPVPVSPATHLDFRLQ